MSINTNFYVPTKAIEWQGQAVCEVRGLTPDDIACAISENAADMESLVLLIEQDKTLASLGTTDPAVVQASLEANTQRLFGTILTTVPNLVAKLIALACDSPDQWQYVKKNYVVPLQFEIAREIAILTFVDGEGFKKFLGNVLALVGSASGQRQPSHQAHNELETETADTVG